MAHQSLSLLSDHQLRRLFSLTAGIGMSNRITALRAELERRGYVYDERSKGFIPCEDWNEYHVFNPKDCDERMKSSRKG